jgi:hypothetical protein
MMFDPREFGDSVSNLHVLGHIVPKKKMTFPRKIQLTDRNGVLRTCTAEAFNTTHQIFILIRDEGPAPKVALPSPGFKANPFAL